MKMKTILSLILMGTLAACGGGGGGSGIGQNHAPNTQAQATPSNVAPQTTNPTNKPSHNPTPNTAPTNPPINNTPTSFTPIILPPNTPTVSIHSLKVKPAPENLQAELQKAIQYTNQLRAEKGLPALKYDARLAAYAQRRAEEIVGRLSHIRPDSNQVLTNVRTNNSYMGENLAAGSNSAQGTVLGQWKQSKGHYGQIINPEATKIGMGLVYVPGSEYGYYWVQIFGSEDIEILNYEFDNSAYAKQNYLLNVQAATDDKFASVDGKTRYLKVDDVMVPLTNVKGQGSWENFRLGNNTVDINAYRDVRFGVLQGGNANPKVFYSGTHTEYHDMPQTGSAHYTGKAVIVDKQTVNMNVDARFTADFSNKQLNGTLSENGRKAVDINAVIRGASFQSPLYAPVETKGLFFGSGANELGGVFYEHNTGKYGAFGAKQ